MPIIMCLWAVCFRRLRLFRISGLQIGHRDGFWAHGIHRLKDPRLGSRGE